MTTFEPITDPVYWYAKDKTKYCKNMKSKASGSGEKNMRPITKRPRHSYPKTPYENPYKGKSAYDAYLADPENYIQPK